MKFETTPQLFVTIEEYKILDQAMELCKNMDEQTSYREGGSCLMCPFEKDCSWKSEDCVYTQAHSALQKIIDIAIIKSKE